ncbi:protein JINGUBANG [Brachypodium distachyon]|uniref:protein JINGUBANG n=1 Tax=Brachypodium distachyon TaxID=15368 RepID=UPI00052FFBB8|nr:protein JINGUBANG [Brachypodium distachyon]|eukprot:XP_010232813.1 protein JINGUBANG [Brachypodium distachyon]
MAIMPDQDRAALSAPLLPRPVSLSTSSSFSASSSPAADAAAAAPMPMPRDTACCKALAVLRDAHPGGGSVSCLSLCGEFLLSASTGADIVAWQQPDLRRFARFGHGGEGAVKALAASGGRVFSAHQDGRVRVWRVSRCYRSENAFKLVTALPTTRDYLGKVFRQASYDGAAQQSRRRRGGRRRLWIEHADSISCLALHDGNVYSGSWDKTLKVWRMADLRCVESIRAHDDAINAVAADAGIIYSASADGRVKAWEKGKAGGSHSLQGILIARDGVSWNAVAVSADGGGRRRVYAAGSDGHLVGWDRLGGGGEVRWSLACDVKAHAMAVLCLCVAGDLVCTGSADKTMGLWRRQTSGGGLARIGAVGGHEGPVKCLQASWCRASNGCMVYSGGLDKSIRVWWVPSGQNGDDEQRNEKGTKDDHDHKPRVFLR